MSITTTITSKGQLTIPKTIREKLGLKPGSRIDIYPTANGFIGKPKRKSRILDYLGDLASLDQEQPLKEIRQQAQELASKEIAKKLK